MLRTSRSGRRAHGLWALAAFIAVATHPGCGSSPTGPIPQLSLARPEAPAPPPITDQQPSAVLTIEHVSVEEHPPRPDLDRNGRPIQDYYAYTVRFLLRETGGNSGAQIEEVVVDAGQGGGDSTGPSCWRDNLWVPRGGTLDVFYSDEGFRWLGYCAPSTGSRMPLASVRVSVFFQAENNRKASVEAVIPVR